MAKRVLQLSARGSTAPPREAGSYMTAASDATVPHRVLSQAQQRIAELKQELAKMKTSSTVNTAAAAFPFGNYGYNVEYCSGPAEEFRCVTP